MGTNLDFVPLSCKAEKIHGIQRIDYPTWSTQSAPCTDCAITLSTGEATKAEYQQLFDAGADRFLLRHETHNADHYQQLHPPRLLASHRQQCLWDLKEIGYQVGTGFMVGSPGQTSKHLAEDLLFLKELNPQMVGIVLLSRTMIHRSLHKKRGLWS